VERMEKKSCKFSITQFEFDLEPYQDEIEVGKEKRKWENSEIELLKKYYGVLNIEDLSKMFKKSSQAIEDKWQQLKPEPETLLTNVFENVSEKVQILPTAEMMEPEPGKKQRRGRKPKQELKQEPEIVEKPRRGRKPKQELKQEPEIVEKPRRGRRPKQELKQEPELGKKPRRGRKPKQELKQEPETVEKPRRGRKPKQELKQEPELGKKSRRGRRPKQEPENVETTQKSQKESPKRKRGEAWDINLDMYRKGEKSNVISTWIALNKREYKTGKLSEKKLEKLMEIDFPFETSKKKKPIIGTND